MASLLSSENTGYPVSPKIRFSEPDRGCPSERKPRRGNKDLTFISYIDNTVRKKSSEKNCPPEFPYLKYDVPNQKYCCVDTLPELLDALEFIVEVAEANYYKMDIQGNMNEIINYFNGMKKFIIRRLNNTREELTPEQKEKFQALLKTSQETAERDNLMNVENQKDRGRGLIVPKRKSTRKPKPKRKATRKPKHKRKATRKRK